MIKSSVATVYHGGGKRYFTLKAACRAEARKKVQSTYLDRGWELDEIYGDPSGRNQTVIERLARLYYRQARRAALRERE